MKGKSIILIKVLLILLASSTALAMVPTPICYQGLLTDNKGVAVNSTVSMTFSIYDATTGGNLLWSDTRSVTPEKGVFSVFLDTGLAFDKPYWLGVQIDGDEEMAERVPLTSSGQAIRAGYAEDVTDNAITGDMISNGAVTRQKLAGSCATGEVLHQSSSGWVCGPSPQ